MKVLLPLLVSLALFFGAAESRAQISNGVQQNGPVTAADCASWLSSGVIQDSGGSCAPNTVAPITATYTVGSGGNFPTITAALAFTNNLLLPVGGIVTLNVLDGGTTEPAAVYWGSVFGKQIAIQSQHSYTTTTTSVQSSSGSAGAYSVILNVGSVAHTATTEDVAITACSGGTAPLLLEGDWAVTNVDAVNTRITITYTGQSATLPSGNVVCTVTVLPKIIFAGTDGIDVWNGTTAAAITGVSLVGNNTAATTGLSVEDGDRAFVGTILGVRNFYNGVGLLYDSHLNGGTVLSDANSADGFNSQFNGVLDLTTGIANGNVNNGLTNDKSGASYICDGGTGCTLSSNGNDGALTGDNSTTLLGATVADYNTTDGSQAQSSGYVSDGSATLANNGSTNNADYLIQGNQSNSIFVQNSTGYYVDELTVDANGDGEIITKTHGNTQIGFFGNDNGELLIESEPSGAFLYNYTGTNWEVTGALLVPTNLLLSGSASASGDGIYNGATHAVNVSVSGSSVAQFTSTGLNSAAIGATTPSTGVFSSVNVTGSNVPLQIHAVNLAEDVTPTCAATGGSPSCTVNAHNGSMAMKMTLGSCGSCTSLTITPGFTAATAWYCTASDATTSTERLFQNTALSTTAPVLTFFNAAGTATSPGASDVIVASCVAM